MKLVSVFTVTAAVAGLCLGAFSMQSSGGGAQTQNPLPKGVCEGVGSQEPGSGAVLDCVDWECPDEACWAKLTETAWGEGAYCQCRTTGGPGPQCCSLVFDFGTGGFTSQGDCNAPNCGTAGSCTVIVIPATRTTPAVAFVNCG